MLEKFFYDNLESMLHGESIDYTPVKAYSFSDLYHTARAHGIDSFMFQTLLKSDVSFFDYESINEVKKTITMKSLLMKKKKYQIVEIIKRFNQENIDIIMLKGMHYAKMYTRPEYRSYGDVDILVSDIDFERASFVVESLGYTLSDHERGMTHHVVYTSRGSVTIELHRALVLEEQFPNQSQINSDIFKDNVIVRHSDYYYNAPNPEMDFVYCLFHMYKHYIGCGVGFKHLFDIKVMINHYDLDWINIQEKLESYKMTNFFIAVMQLQEKYLNEVLPENFDWSCNDLLDIIAHDIYESGASGSFKKDRFLSCSLADYSKSPGVLNKVKYLFPPHSHISKSLNYEYCKDNKLLLPVAWGHRILRNLKANNISMKQNFIDNGIIENRMKITKWLTEDGQ